MKKKVLLLAFCFLLIPPIVAFAQNEAKAFPADPLKAYEDWKRNKLGERAEMVKHYALAVVSKRTSNDGAQLDIAAIGQMANGFMLEVQPIVIDQKPNGQPGEEVGEVTTTSLTTADPQADLPSPATIKLILRVPSNANALKIKWLFSQRAKGDDGKETLAPQILELWVGLGNAPESSVAAVMRGAVK